MLLDTETIAPEATGEQERPVRWWNSKEHMAKMRARQVEKEKEEKEAPIELVGATEEEQRSYRAIIDLVWRCLGSRELPAKVDSRAKVLHRWARKNEGEFMVKYAPMLMRSEEKAQESVDEGGEAVAGLLEEWLKAYRGRKG